MIHIPMIRCAWCGRTVQIENDRTRAHRTRGGLKCHGSHRPRADHQPQATHTVTPREDEPS